MRCLHRIGGILVIKRLGNFVIRTRIPIVIARDENRVRFVSTNRSYLPNWVINSVSALAKFGCGLRHWLFSKKGFLLGGRILVQRDDTVGVHHDRNQADCILVLIVPAATLLLLALEVLGGGKVYGTVGVVERFIVDNSPCDIFAVGILNLHVGAVARNIVGRSVFASSNFVDAINIIVAILGITRRKASKRCNHLVTRPTAWERIDLTIYEIPDVVCRTIVRGKCRVIAVVGHVLPTINVLPCAIWLKIFELGIGEFGTDNAYSHVVVRDTIPLFLHRNALQTNVGEHSARTGLLVVAADVCFNRILDTHIRIL